MSDSPDHAKLASLPYLKAIIDETLRLSPPAPVTGIFRMTPAEGMTIGKRYIPGHVSVFVPIYVVHHDERYWRRAEEFVPERWLEKREELMDETGVFAPFGHVSLVPDC